MNTGDLRHQVELQARSLRDDGMGGKKISGWDTVAKPWARVEALSAMQRFVAGQHSHGISHRVTIRHRGGVNADQRILFKSTRKLYIDGVRDPNGRRQWLELDCKEKS